MPPVINQFTQTLDCQTAAQLPKLAPRYRPETEQEEKPRPLAWAEKKVVSKADVSTEMPLVLQARVNTVTTLWKTSRLSR